MANIFFTADTHFGHTNIIRHSNRPFSCADEMDETIIENWNKRIESPSDIVYHLGDFAFFSSTLIVDPRQIFARLKGRKVLILGNHDKAPTTHMGWEAVKDVLWLTGFNQAGIWMSHYAHRSWKNSFHGSWHLFGHSHNKLDPYGLSFDAGVDANNFQLWHIDEVTSRIQNLIEYYAKQGIKSVID